MKLILDHRATTDQRPSVVDQRPPGRDVCARQMHRRQLVQIQKRRQLARVDAIVLATGTKQPRNLAGVSHLNLPGQRTNDAGDPLGLRTHLESHLNIPRERTQDSRDRFDRRRTRHRTIPPLGTIRRIVDAERR